MTCEGDLGKTLPLEGIRVLDFSPYIAGPYCPALLGDMGAEVIKIEAHRGNQTPYFPSTLTGETRRCLGANRNEQGSVLDLKHEVARENVYKLTKTINVVVEHFRPGLSYRLQIGYEQLSIVNPRLVYCSISRKCCMAPSTPLQHLVNIPRRSGTRLIIAPTRWRS